MIFFLIVILSTCQFERNKWTWRWKSMSAVIPDQLCLNDSMTYTTDRRRPWNECVKPPSEVYLSSLSTHLYHPDIGLTETNTWLLPRIVYLSTCTCS